MVCPRVVLPRAVVLVAVLSSWARVSEAVLCHTCATNQLGATEEAAQNCIDGVNLEDTALDCEAEGWGDQCITRAYAHAASGTLIYLRSCTSPAPMTCEQGHQGFVDGSEVWTTCCSEDYCNDKDPLEELGVVTEPNEEDTTTESPGIECLVCATADPNNSEEDIENGASGHNLQAVNCKDDGWGDVCIARVFILASTGMEVWLRSCVAPAPMTCESGYTNYGDSGEVWTLCCDTDGCNNHDPRDDYETTTDLATTTEEEPEYMKCYYCSSNNPLITDEEKLACETGVGLENFENNMKDCGGIWGDECITTVFKNVETEELIWSRDCVAPPPMTCDEGHDTIYQGWEYWRSCCTEDYCNGGDPRPEEESTTTEVATTESDGIKCIYCTTATDNMSEEDIQTCEQGIINQDNVMDCEAEGWGDQCITRVYKTVAGKEWWIRSCLGPVPMTCEAGYVQA